MTTVNSRPAKVTWRVTAGYTATLTLTFVDDDNDAINLTGRSFTAAAAAYPGAATSTISVDTTNAATGEIVLTIDNATLASITGRWVWWLTETVAGEPRPLLDGPLEIASVGQAGINGTTSNALTVQVVSANVQVVTTSVTGPLTFSAVGVTADYVLTAQGDGTYAWEPITLLP